MSTVLDQSRVSTLKTKSLLCVVPLLDWLIILVDETHCGYERKGLSEMLKDFMVYVLIPDSV